MSLSQTSRASCTPGTCRARLEITNRSGWLTRQYRLIFHPDHLRLAYLKGRVQYTLRFDEQSQNVCCSCPAFEADGSCKHKDSLLALLEGLARRLGRAS